MRTVRWITKATDTRSEYVILIALPRQQWLRERVLISRYTYIACLVMLDVIVGIMIVCNNVIYQP